MEALDELEGVNIREHKIDYWKGIKTFYRVQNMTLLKEEIIDSYDETKEYVKEYWRNASTRIEETFSKYWNKVNITIKIEHDFDLPNITVPQWVNDLRNNVSESYNSSMAAVQQLTNYIFSSNQTLNQT